MPIVVMPDGTHVQMPDVPPPDLPQQDSPGWAGVKAAAVSAVRGPLLSTGGLLSMVKDPSGGQTALSTLGDYLQQKTNQYLPKPTAGNAYVNSAVEGGTGALISPGGPAKNIITGVVAGLGGQAGENLTNGNPVGRTLGTFAGGVAGGIGANAVRTGSAQARAVAQAAVAGLPEGALEKAQAFQAQAATQGVTLDLVQALEGIGTPAPALQTVRDVLAGKTQGQQVQATLRGQPGQLEVAGDVALGGVPGAVREESVAANNLGAAATARVNAEKAARSAAVAPLYAQAGDLGPQVRKDMADTLSQFLATPGVTADSAAAAQTALARLKSAPGTQAPTTHALDYDSLISDLTGAYKGTPLSPPDPKTTGQLKNLAGQLNTQLQAASPALAQAETKFGQISRDVVDPLKQGPVGTLATARGYRADTPASVAKMNSLFAKGTDPQASTSAIVTAGQELNKVDPGAFADAAKTYYSGKLGQAFDSTLSGGQVSNADAAPRVLANLFADRKQWQGMKDAAAVIADGAGIPRDDVIAGLENFATITKAAANRPTNVGGIGAGDVGTLASRGLTSSAMKMVGVAPLKPLASAWENARMGQTFATFDDLLTSPDGAATLAKLGKVDPTSPAAQAILATWGASRAHNSDHITTP